MQIKHSALAEVKLEIAAYNETDYQTFKKGLRLIELFTSIRNYIQRPGNELEKARIAKLVLLNPTLKNRTIGINYQKPFDVLLNFDIGKNLVEAAVVDTSCYFINDMDKKGKTFPEMNEFYRLFLIFFGLENSKMARAAWCETQRPGNWPL